MVGYSNFRTIKTVVRRFNLDLQMHRLFEEVTPVAPTPWLQETLAETEFFPPTNEKAKSERIISPVLTEVARQWKGRISFFSGENIDIDPAQAATDGIEWRFLRLQDNQFVLDTRVYTDLSEVLGGWQTIMRAYV